MIKPKIIKIILLSFAATIFSCSNLKYGNYFESPYKIIQNEDFNTIGVIFPDSVNFPLGLREPINLEKRYSPSVEDVRIFEKIFHNKYEAFRKTRDYYNPDFSITAVNYRDYIRQYFGYIDYEEHKYSYVIFRKLTSKKDRNDWYLSPTYSIPGSFILVANIETGELISISDLIALYRNESIEET